MMIKVWIFIIIQQDRDTGCSASVLGISHSVTHLISTGTNQCWGREGQKGRRAVLLMCCIVFHKKSVSDACKPTWL